MCDPLTAVVVAGVGASAIGSYQQSKAAKNAAKYNAAVSRNNAILAERQAKDRITQGKQEENTFRKQLSQLKGKQRSIYAGSGIVVDEGTPLDILEETAELGEIDAFTIRRNAEREAYGYKVQAQGFTSQAGLQTMQEKSINPYFTAGTTLLTQGSKAAMMFASPSTSAPVSQNNRGANGVPIPVAKPRG